MKAIYCTPAAFEAQKSNSRLHQAATLARIVNSLRFAQAAARDRLGDNSPAASRQRASSFFYVCGLLYEGFRFADRLGKDFKSSHTFQECFAPLLSEDRVKSLRAGVLNRLRNKAVYHHDDDVFSKGLALLQENELVFATADGDKPSDVSYDLADIAVLRFALNSSSPTGAFQNEVSGLMVDVVEAATRFSVCADSLIRETLRGLGWQYPSSSP
jgi:hypothetical protein